MVKVLVAALSFPVRTERIFEGCQRRADAARHAGCLLYTSPSWQGGADVWRSYSHNSTVFGRRREGKKNSLVTTIGRCFFIIAQRGDCRCGRLLSLNLVDGTWASFPHVNVRGTRHRWILDVWRSFATEQTVCFHFNHRRQVRFGCLKRQSMTEPQSRTELLGRRNPHCSELEDRMEFAWLGPR